MNYRKPNLCIVGNLLGRHRGHVTTQGQVIADLLKKDGFHVVSVSSKQNRAFRIADVVSTLLRFRRSIDISIVEVYSGLGFLLADIASFISNLSGISSVFVLHGGNLPEFIKRHPNWTSRVFKRADILVAPSTYLAQEMKRFGFNVQVIPNIIELNKYPFKFRRVISPKMIWMRSFQTLYNPKMALIAFTQVKSELPNASLVMAGVDKGLESEIKDSVELLGLQDSVRFPGFLDESSKLVEFSNADIYLNTNMVDNMPVSVIEACAMGLPVVATDVGGVSHLITNELNGLLVQNDNAEMMADAIRKLIDDPNLTERISQNGRLLAANSAWSKVCIQWRELFESLMAKRKHFRGRP